ncbi:MAG: hypothetical protein AAF560_23550 [Acidobacteriota bacterium]
MPSQDKPAKERILSLVRELPDNTSYDEVLRELAFVRMVDRGLADAEHHRDVDSAELKERMRAWQG